LDPEPNWTRQLIAEFRRVLDIRVDDVIRRIDELAGDVAELSDRLDAYDFEAPERGPDASPDPEP
jgi:hypothetical protein